jgi:serine/threonine-protein kinase
MATQSCPTCGRVHDVASYVSGQKVLCGCGIKFEVKRNEIAAAAPAHNGFAAAASSALPNERTFIAPAPRVQIPGFELTELLGRGGMGEVWRARHRMLARDAAIKLVRPEVLGASSEAETRSILRRFEREAQATAALSSPHTINLFDFGTTHEGAFYYVMELLSGRDLESLIREFGPLPASRAVYLLRQVCHSLADAHSRGIVHRDIKPANIYVCRMGLDYDFVKVLDFGLVKVRDQKEAGQTLLTAEHGTTGTPAYMAPEVILGEADIDRRADVYALGCVAYYMLTGQLVFDADTPMKMLVQHVQSRPVPPSQRTELHVPRELDELVLACLEKDPNRRPRDAGELFALACRCQSPAAWDTARAQAWWEQHLPELTGALGVPGAGADTAPARLLAVS